MQTQTQMQTTTTDVAQLTAEVKQLRETVAAIQAQLNRMTERYPRPLFYTEHPHIVRVGELTPAQVFDALSYYYDHPGEIDQYIAENQGALERAWQPRDSS